MAIRRRRELPTELPPARLYLDDLAEIKELFIRAAQKEADDTARKYPALAEERKLARDNATQQVTTRFVVGELVCDELGDLRNVGRSTTRFRLTVETDWQYCHARLELALHGTTTECFFYGLTEEASWALYANVREVFDRRGVAWKKVLRGIPVWGYIVLILAFSFILRLIPATAKVPLFSWSGLLVLASGALVFLIYYGAGFQHSIAHLRYSHEQPGLLNKVGEWWSHILFAIGGAIAAGIATKIVRLLWPD